MSLFSFFSSKVEDTKPVSDSTKSAPSKMDISYEFNVDEMDCKIDGNTSTAINKTVGGASSSAMGVIGGIANPFSTTSVVDIVSTSSSAMDIDDELPQSAVSSFLDTILMDVRAKKSITPSAFAPSPDTVTENGAPAYTTTGNARLDLFFGGFVRGAPKDKLRRMLPASWKESPEDTIKLILHSRDARAGKGEKAVSIIAMMWLREKHPITYIRNLENFLAVGYYKDLLNIAVEVFQSNGRLLALSDEIIELKVIAKQLETDISLITPWLSKMEKELDDSSAGKSDANVSVINKLVAGLDKISLSTPSADDSRIAKIRLLLNKAPPSISLAGKWAPTEKTHYDKHAHGRLALRVSRLMYKGTNPNDYQKKYRKNISMLRECLKVVERSMCLGLTVEYSHVPSKAHNIYKKAFMKHDVTGYTEYLAKLKNGDTKINTTGLQPHELSRQYITGKERAVEATVEAQWKTLVTKLMSAGLLDSALSIVDVSGSMSGVPMEVAITLGLILAEMQDGPWKGRMITFSADPAWHHVKGDTLFQKVHDAMKMPWGMNTDLLKVFTMILDVAVKNKVASEDMPKKLFIFSDMQFDTAACTNGCYYGGYGHAKRDAPPPFNSTHQTITDMFTKAGYTAPGIVYWNLRGDTATFPVDQNAKNVSMVSGFSADLLKLFLDGADLSAAGIMHKAIAPYDAIIEESER